MIAHFYAQLLAPKALYFSHNNTYMNQEQKDTIREEFYAEFTEPTVNPKQIAEWWLNKLDQAYQQGVESRQDEIDFLREEAYGDLKDNT
jgi:hypothetical protein